MNHPPGNTRGSLWLASSRIGSSSRGSFKDNPRLDPTIGRWYFRQVTRLAGRQPFQRGFRLPALRRDTRGVVMVEYAVLMGIVGITCVTAFILLGVAFANSFGFVRGMLLVPFP